MSDVDFYPAPVRSGRSILRWILLLGHAVLFALFIFAYPSLSDRIDLLTGNLAQILIPVWAGVLVLHVLLVTAWDAVEGFVIRRKRRARVREYRRMKNRQRLLNQVTNAIDIDQPPEEESNSEDPEFE